ncbi:5' nucleotidase, NT5C type [Pseudalkalibacillus hwajinpoensis]|uniref:5'(3')-deoxyribonucleotidase n=1 Tax=Guptibacillus hwajinpoensis TaxID=208199 RepID=A0A4U1MEU7_9BACL|nr:5'(3')-deoxyribonucleotidase [Pseudalkalibacillus hwajinpoensis]TKD69799.1 5'(3')-deoxyribonucleotidase [Pseudalkalibacillus hwajinpoensis]
MKTLLIDMDSVICDLMSEWHKRYNEDYNDNLSIEKLQCWRSEDYVKAECGEKIYDYLDEPGLFLHLEPLPNAIDVLKRISKHYDVLIVTSSRTYAYTEKEMWIEKHLPFIGKKNLIFSHRKEMIRGDMLFDDAPHNLIAFKETGRTAVAMNYVYNQQVDVPRVNNWLEFEKWLSTWK